MKRRFSVVLLLLILLVAVTPCAYADTETYVYLGGYPIGLTIDGVGVTVVGLNEFVNVDGKLCCPSVNAGLQINDTIISLDGKTVHNSSRLAEIANASKGRIIAVTFLRDGVTFDTTVQAEQELSGGQYRIGLWTRDASGGIGTLTYVQRNLHFGSLGHPVCDNKGNLVACKNGGVYTCKVSGVVKGLRGQAGELKGNFSYEDIVGNLVTNNKFGAYGNFNKLPDYCKELVPVAEVGEVTPGKAEIYCTLEGDKRRSYNIEIVKVIHQTSASDKGMIIHVMDERLLEVTGGIVQGMSGSPIIQNGKLVGAVTHVFVNDPTRGYGIFAEWMLNN